MRAFSCGYAGQSGTFTLGNSAEKGCGVGRRNTESAGIPDGEQDRYETDFAAVKQAFAPRKPLRAQYVVSFNPPSGRIRAHQYPYWRKAGALVNSALVARE